MAPKYVLTDFVGRGAAEPIRYILSYGHLEFTNNRVPWPPDTPEIASLQLPSLEVDGKILHKYLAICQYLGCELGIAGANSWEAAQINSVAESVYDLGLLLPRVIYCKDPVEKQKLKETYVNETMPFMYRRLERRLAENGGHAFGGKITYADLVVVALLDLFGEAAPEDERKAAVRLLALQKKVHELPGVKAWLQKRPPYPRNITQLLS